MVQKVAKNDSAADLLVLSFKKMSTEPVDNFVD
mgnify:CR=1 FL=1